MTFEKQVQEAKVKELETKMLRGFIFIILGVIFLIISIVSAYYKENSTNKNTDKEVSNNIIK